MPNGTESTYSNALVSYVDILGFGDLVTESMTNVAKISQLRSILEELRKIGDTPKRHRKHSEERFASFNFSDLIVRSTTIASVMLWYDTVDWEFYYLAEQQMSLAIQGVWVRGGISIGDVYVSPENGIVFGPALIRSYRLESAYAIYPRLVLDRGLVLHARDQGFLPGLDDYIRRGEDGVYFLDYLFCVCISETLLLPEIADVKARVNSHRRAIEMAGNALGKDERVKQKHSWLALYHNSTVRRLQERLGPTRLQNIADLLLPEDGL
jgi:hypothetical protein